MAKFKCGEKAILKATSKEVVIDRVITNFSSKSVRYELKDGKKVTDNDLLKMSEAKKIANVLHKTVKNSKTDINKLAKDIEKVSKKAKDIQIKETEKEVIPAVEQPEKQIDNQEVEKSDSKEEKR